MNPNLRFGLVVGFLLVLVGSVVVMMRDRAKLAENSATPGHVRFKTLSFSQTADRIFWKGKIIGDREWFYKSTDHGDNTLTEIFQSMPGRDRAVDASIEIKDLKGGLPSLLQLGVSLEMKGQGYSSSSSDSFMIHGNGDLKSMAQFFLSGDQEFLVGQPMRVAKIGAKELIFEFLR